MPQHNRLTRGLDALVTIFSVSGAVIMSFGIWEAYWLILGAGFFGTILQYRLRLKAGLIRNVFFFCTSIWGLWNTVISPGL